MASPKLSGGYTQLAHELLDKILLYPFKGYELKIVMKIIRDTYGWKSKKRQISFGKMAEKTKTDRVNIIHTTTILVARNILFKQKLKNKKNLWGINKNYDEWLMPNGLTFQEHSFQEVAEKKKPAWKETWIKNRFPVITEILETEILRLLKEYGEEKFIGALKISVRQNKKKLAYVEGILKRIESGDGNVGKGTKISDGRWMSDEELAKAEMAGEIYYENDKWLTKKQ